MRRAEIKFGGRAAAPRVEDMRAPWKSLWRVSMALAASRGLCWACLRCCCCDGGAWKASPSSSSSSSSSSSPCCRPPPPPCRRLPRILLPPAQIFVYSSPAGPAASAAAAACGRWLFVDVDSTGASISSRCLTAMSRTSTVPASSMKIFVSGTNLRSTKSIINSAASGRGPCTRTECARRSSASTSEQQTPFFWFQVHQRSRAK